MDFDSHAGALHHSSTNYCLQYVDISFYQILRSLVIPMNLSYSYFRFGQVPNPVVLTSCLAVMSGFVLGSVTELNFSTHGFVSGVLSSWFVALYSITVKSTLPLVAGNTWRLMQYTTSLSLFLIAPMIVASGEAVAVASTVATPGLAFNMFVAGLFGFLINLAYFALIKFASPLSTHISGTRPPDHDLHDRSPPNIQSSLCVSRHPPSSIMPCNP
jgi:GDP-fucose transporter C1